MDLSIVFCNYDTSSLLTTCLQSIERFPPGCSYEVVIINNGSRRDTAESLQGLGEHLRIVDLPSNVGFGQACNIGMKVARGRYILLLNTDTYFIDSSLEKCWNFAVANPQVDIFTCKLRFPDGRSQSETLPLYANPMLEAVEKVLAQNALAEKFNRNLFSLGKQPRLGQPALSGCFLFLKKTVFEKTGGFDPDFYLYFEETEWFRNRIYPNGLRSAVLQDALVVHIGGASQTPRALNSQFTLSSLLYFYKCGKATFVAAYLAHLLNFFTRLVCMPFVPHYFRQNLVIQRKLLYHLSYSTSEVLRYPRQFASRPYPLMIESYREHFSWSRLSEVAAVRIDMKTKTESGEGPRRSNLS